MSRDERRLAAIMFTDIVGYTSLSQRNETLALQRLEEHRRILRELFEKHDGKEIKTMGDAFLVEFGSALGALRCAFEAQQALHELNSGRAESDRTFVRIGIHLGDVIRRQGDVYGDAVNIASRIQPLAKPGGICISSHVYEQVRNKFELPLLPLGQWVLKNVGFPIQVYEVRLPWDVNRELERKGLDRLRLAVLPLDNISADPGDGYFADGMTEELISTISRIRGLRVIARTSVMHYKATPKTIADIGRELNVGTVLEGSVRKSADRIRISVQLIESESEEHLWAEDYDRKMEDVFDIQKDIATKVAQELKVRLLSGEQRSIEKKDTGNSAAFMLYLKGRYYWNERRKEGLTKAREYFEKAIELDPKYARAYSGLADAYSLLAFDNYVPSNHAHAQQKLLIERALELDNTLAEAHTSMGSLLGDIYDWNGAEREFRTALELNPSYPTAHFWYSILLTYTKRHAEAVEQARLAQELDPLAPAMMIAVGQALAYARRYDEAKEELTRMASLNPEISAIRFILALTHLFSGDNQQALEHARKAVSLDESPPERHVLVMGMAEARLGMTEDARRILANLEARSAQNVILAGLHQALGDTDETIGHLEKAISLREAGLPWIKAFPPYDQLMADPRYTSILARMNLFDKSNTPGSPS